MYYKSLMLFSCIVLSGCATSVASKSPRATPHAVVSSTAPVPDIVTLVAPSPPPGSQIDKDDIATLLAFQAQRTQKDCDFAQADVEISLKRFLAPLGLTLNGDTIQSDALFARLKDFLKTTSDVVKRKYERPRPYLYDTRITPCISKVPSSSYAYTSGHTAWAYLTAAMLTQMVPERHAEWYARAATYARSRVLGGVHYPSDVDFGKVVGLIAAERALRDPIFVGQLAQTKPELRRALGY